MQIHIDTLPLTNVSDALRAQASEWEKGRDTMDVWFDSGSSWAGVVSMAHRKVEGEPERF